jgi:hypothetical protein
MFQHVGANNVIELASQGRKAVVEIGAGELHRRRVRTIRPIDAGHGKPALGQNLRQVSDGASHIQHPFSVAAFREFG